MNDLQPEGPEIFFLPLAVADAPQVSAATGVAAETLARRIPDFVHQVLNGLDSIPTGMLEVQTPAEEDPVRWVVFDEPPEPEDAFDLLPDDEEPKAVVLGTLEAVTGGLQVVFTVHRSDALDSGVSTQVRGTLSSDDPILGAKKLSERLARVLELPWSAPPANLLTRNARAFFKFLEGLDNAALLSGDLAIEPTGTAEELMKPFTEALALDPGFGLALRVAHATLAEAVAGARIDTAECKRIFDGCFEAAPSDGEGCVQVADHLSVLGDDERAMTWLQHATHLVPPPPKSLENLGILMANKGQAARARDLWMQGVEVDGHPDFFAHLARLAFSEGNVADAWDKVWHGLRRLLERARRAGEWDDDGRGAGVLLRYLVDHLAEMRPHAVVIDALVELVGVLDYGEDRIDLGLCLIAVRKLTEARTELEGALRSELEPAIRDQAVRALLGLDVPDFEKRFRKAVDQIVGKKGFAAGLGELEVFLEAQPAFWPALFFKGVALQRRNRDEEALDLMAEVLHIRPGQPDALNELGVLFDRRGNSKRALECIEEALGERPDDVQLMANQALFLAHLGRIDEARLVLKKALETAPHDPDLRRILRELD